MDDVKHAMLTALDTIDAWADQTINSGDFNDDLVPTIVENQSIFAMILRRLVEDAP